jgi:hypothetical protein
MARRGVPARTPEPLGDRGGSMQREAGDLVDEEDDDDAC